MIDGVQIRIVDLIHAITKRYKLIIALTIVGLVSGILLSGATSLQTSGTQYKAKTSFVITSENADGKYVNNTEYPTQNDYHLAEDMVDSVIYILKSDTIIKSVVEELNMIGVTASNVKSRLSFSQYHDTPIVEMSLDWYDQDEAVTIMNAIIAAGNRKFNETLHFGKLEIINSPSTHQIVTNNISDAKKIVLITTAIGFLAAFGFALMEIILHPTLVNLKDVENIFGLETIGTIPTRENTKDAPGIETGDLAQDYMAASYIIKNRLGKKTKHQCIYVTSSMSGEGKSTVAANVAYQLAEQENKVLLVDFDIYRPTVGTMFLKDVDYSSSLNALYNGDATINEAVIKVSGFLDIMPAILQHNAVPLDNTLFDMIRNISANYDYVILDAPPIGEVSTTLRLNQIANAVLFVIRFDTVIMQEIRNSLDTLSKSGIRILGCVVTDVKDTPIERTAKKKYVAEQKEKNKESAQELDPELLQTEPSQKRTLLESMMGEIEQKEEAVKNDEMFEQLVKMRQDRTTEFIENPDTEPQKTEQKADEKAAADPPPSETDEDSFEFIDLEEIPEQYKT